MGSERRLLFITERFEPDLGGVARSATRTAWALARLGIAVEVLCWTRSVPAGERQSFELAAPEKHPTRLLVHRVGAYANQDSTFQHTMTFLDSRHGASPFNAAWGHYLSPAGFLAVYFGRSAQIPVTVSARGNDIDLMMFPPGDFARLTWTLENATSVTAVSKDLAEKIRVLMSSGFRVHVVPNSVDLEEFQRRDRDEALRESLGILPEEAVLGFSGELRHKKGLHPLLAAFQQVRYSRPACLLVIGEVRTRDQTALLSLNADDPESRRRLIITGHLEQRCDVARHLALCDLFLQPSHWDGLPNSVLEAMACERVVLASDAGGIPEAIEHGKSGFLLPRHQLDQLGPAILELLTLSERQRATIGCAARERICERFSPECESAALQRVLDELW